MKKIVLIITAAAAFACSGSPVLEREGWQRDVHRALCKVIREAAGSPCTPYAVFDCDNTSIIHDISQAVNVYQIENLLFADAPSHGFLDGIPDKSVMLYSWGMTAAQAGEILSDEYRQLKALQEGGMSLEEIHALPLYLDFRARFFSFDEALGEVSDYGTMCIWQPALLSGMSKEEVRELVKAAIKHSTSIPVEMQEWTSPDGRFSFTTEMGLRIPENTRNLFKALKENGIEAYIVSASLEYTVEILACDPEIGFGLDEDHVFGIRFTDGDTITGEPLEGYHQPYREGKVDCIKAYISPKHCDNGPILVAGDSNGDVAMLTAWPETRCGLIMDCGRSGDIATLSDMARAEKNRGRYVIQEKYAD